MRFEHPYELIQKVVINMAKKDKNRFVIVYEQGGLLVDPTVQIVVDKMTGVQYISASTGYGNILTVLVDRDGKPLLYNNEQ